MAEWRRKKALRIEAGLQAVCEWEAENGAFTEEELAAAERFLAGKPKKQRTQAS